MDNFNAFCNGGIIVATNWLAYLWILVGRILTDKSGTAKIPDSVIREIAMCLLPAVIEFFSTEEGMAEYEAWQKEQQKQETPSKA